MIYSENIKKALKLAYEAHNGQVDKSGYPYIAHPLHLAESMSDEKTTIVALLHDVIEDTDFNLKDIESIGFDIEIIKALELLTYDKNMEYLDYIKTLKNNVIAREVKIADLKHNSDLKRLETVTTKDLARVEKYNSALKLLEDELI